MSRTAKSEVVEAMRTLYSRILDTVYGLTFLEKWLVLGTAIGVASGLFATFFYFLLEVTTYASAVALGVEPGSLTGYADLAVVILDAARAGEALRLYLVPLILVAGAAISSIIVYRWAPEAEGHGTDAAIKAFHRMAGIIRIRVPIIKAVASALTVGTGGSGGVEGPSALMGAGIGSGLAQAMKMNMWDRRTAVLAGMAGALSALFRAPIGAAIFAVEVIYKRDIEVRALVPAIVASIVGYAVSMPFWGYAEVFPKIVVDQRALYTATALLAYIGLGVFMAPFAVLYVKLFYGARDTITRASPDNPYLRPVIGAAGTALLGVFAPYVLGSGRQLLARFLSSPGLVVPRLHGEGVYAFAFFLVLVALAKIVATSLSIGSGGSGGVFAPGITAGALLGYAYGLVVGGPVSGIDPLVFAYMGMGVFFAAASKTPLATSFMVTEMSGSYGLLVPTLLSSYLAREIAREVTIYESQIPHRLRPELINIEAIIELLRQRGVRLGIKAGDIAEKQFKSLTLSDPVAKAIDLIITGKQHIVPVVDANGKLVGVVDGSMLERLFEHKPSEPLSRLELRKPPAVLVDEDIIHVVDVLEEAEADIDYVVVIDENARYKGVILYRDIVAAVTHAYLTQLLQKTKKLRRQVVEEQRKKGKS